MSSRRLKDMPSRHLQDMSSRRLQHVFKTSSRRPQRNNFLSSKTSSRRLQGDLEDVKLLHWRRVEDVFKTNKCLLGYYLFCFLIFKTYLWKKSYEIGSMKYCSCMNYLLSIVHYVYDFISKYLKQTFRKRIWSIY